jgi:hypothetical protein
MIDEQFRRLMQSKGLPERAFTIQNEIPIEESRLQLDMLKTVYEWGEKASVITYDSLSLEEVISRVKAKMNGIFNVIDFSYNQTFGKIKSPDALIKDQLTTGMLSHILEAEETNFNTPTLILYHGFDKIVKGVSQLAEEKALAEKEILSEITQYLDAACGRGWSQHFSHYPRLRKLKEDSPIIRTGLVMSIDEKVANNWFNEHYTSCTRSNIGRDFRDYHIS